MNSVELIDSYDFLRHAEIGSGRPRFLLDQLQYSKRPRQKGPLRQFDYAPKCICFCPRLMVKGLWLGWKIGVHRQASAELAYSVPHETVR